MAGISAFGLLHSVELKGSWTQTGTLVHIAMVWDHVSPWIVFMQVRKIHCLTNANPCIVSRIIILTHFCCCVLSEDSRAIYLGQGLRCPFLGTIIAVMGLLFCVSDSIWPINPSPELLLYYCSPLGCDETMSAWSICMLIYYRDIQPHDGLERRNPIKHAA